MKAILVNEDRSLRWDNVPDPIIKSDEVLVEIHAAARSPPRGAKDLWFSLESFP